MFRFVRNFRIPVLLLCITVAFSWKLVLSRQYTWIDEGDNLNQVAPWLQAQAAQWHTGHFPLWDPNQQTGIPFVGQVQPGTLNPLNWILFSLPLSDGFIQFSSFNWYWVLIQFLAVLFGYLLCRDLRLSHAASILGGCAFGLGGFMGGIHWPQKMMSAFLLPLILMYFLRILRTGRVVPNAALSGALLGASFLSGHHNVPIFFCLVLAGLWIYYFTMVPAGVRQKWIAAAAFGICFGLIAAAQILPADELGKLSLRWVNAPLPVAWDETVPYSVHNQFSLHPAAILDIVIPGQRRAAFIGLVVLALAILGAVSKWREQTVRLLSAISVGGLLFALGGRSIFHGVLYAIIPTLDKARSPDVAIVIFHLGAVVLAAYGLDSLRSAEFNRPSLRMVIRVLSFIALFLYAALIVLGRLQPAVDDSYTFLAQAALVALLFAGILQAWSKSWISARTSSTLVILLLLFELNHVTNYAYQPMAKAEKLHELDDIAAFLKKQPNLPRVDLDEKEISFDFGDWYGVDELRGSLAAGLTPFADTQFEVQFPTLLAANYYIGRKPRTPLQVARFEGKSGLLVYSDSSALPRARIVHAALGMPNAKAIVSAVANPAIDLSRTVILLGPPPALETCEGGDVDVHRYRPTSVVLQVNSPCRGMLLLADSWFPGWKAYVDGKPAQIYRAYNLMRGVVVEGGYHEVVLLYRPSSLFRGIWMAALGVLLCIALQLWGRLSSLPPAF